MSKSDLVLMEESLNDPLVILANENPDKIFFLEGIKNHQFVDVTDEDSMVKALNEIIKEIKAKGTNTIIFVPDARFDAMASYLKAHHVISTTKRGMNQNHRDATVEEFLNKTHLLLTSSIWARDMGSDFYDKVGLIVNYGPPWGRYEYIQRLSWFQKVDAATTFVKTPDDWWERIVEFQETYPIVFERRFGFGRKETTIKAAANESQQYFIFNVGDNKRKFGRVLEIMCKFLIAAGTSVIFVESDKSWLNGAMKGQKNGDCITFSDNVEVFEGMEDNNNNSVRVLVITDDASNDNKKVPLVINYDIPSEIEDYHHRFGWCQGNGSIVHIATQFDWFNILDMQIMHHVGVTSLMAYFGDTLRLLSGSCMEIEESEDDEPLPDPMENQEEFVGDINDVLPAPSSDSSLEDEDLALPPSKMRRICENDEPCSDSMEIKEESVVDENEVLPPIIV